MNNHVTALFREFDNAGRAVQALLEQGVTQGEISLVANEGTASHFGVHEGSKAPEGVVASGLIGGALGAIGSTLITAASAGAGIFATGPILVGLAGLGGGGALGGLAGSLAGLGVPEHEARFYEQEIRKRDAILVGVASLRHDPIRIKNTLNRYCDANVAEGV